jgi:DNA primase
VLVEGVLDVQILRSNDIESVAALGGSTVARSRFELLSDLGVEQLVLAFDNDAPGRIATSRAVETAVRLARHPPAAPRHRASHGARHRGRHARPRP